MLQGGDGIRRLGSGRRGRGGGAGGGGTAENVVALAMEGRGTPRAGNPILSAGEPAGAVTSGTFSPSLGIGIGMGYVRSSLADPGTLVEIDVRGRVREAEIRSKPLYAKTD